MSQPFKLCSFAILAVSLLALPIAGCGKGDSKPPPGSSPAVFQGTHPINVVATVGMVGDLVRGVGGDYVKVQQICGSGVDPHTFAPTRDDMQAIMSADMVFYCGLMLEGKMSDTLVKISKGKPVFAVTDSIEHSQLLEPEDFDGHADPHVWNDVSLWSQAIKSVENALIDFDPTNADVYAKNATQMREDFAKLHQYGIDSVATIPEGKRLLVTSHDAFNYFGRAYGLEVAGVQGLSTESEAGVQRINELVDLLVAKKVEAVFIESSVSRKNIDALVEGVQSKGHKVVIGGELFSDAMGDEGTYEGTYMGMLDHNLTIVTKALGGQVEASGFGGKLAEHGGQ